MLFIVAVLIVVPDDHQSFGFVFGETINNSGFSQGMFWFYVLPLGFLLTQYTITGFDASAHISEETHGAEDAAPGAGAAVRWRLIVTRIEKSNSRRWSRAPVVTLEARISTRSGFSSRPAAARRDTASTPPATWSG